ncbi:MAG: hypothetical protein IJ230_05170 [Clostridia bacterium]|nr:hypothetical protein [Clostridia bacterium]
MKASVFCEPDRGSYTVEAALSLTVFTACLMALLSILTVIKTEAEISDALHETAMELSQYSYVYGRTEYLKEEAEERLPVLQQLLGSDDEGFSDLALTGPAVAKFLTKENFSKENADEWLKKQGVEKGYEGLDFMDTQVLMDGKTIRIVANYNLKVQTFGLFEKTLHQRAAAVTYGLLPTDAALKAGRQKPAESTIWQESNFVRGRYFAEKVRSAAEYGAPVKPGQGIDLYDAASGTYGEVESINLFLPSYATSPSGESSADARAAAFTPRKEAVEKALFGYVKGLSKDISTLGKEVTLADGSTVKTVQPRRKILILVVPEEVKQNKSMKSLLSSLAEQAQVRQGVTVEVRYEQKALVQNREEAQV